MEDDRKYNMQATQIIQKKHVTLEDIYGEIRSLREEMIAKLDLIRFKLDDALLPVEQISDEESEELDRIEKEPGRNLEDVMAEIDGEN